PARFVRRRRVQILTGQVRKQYFCVPRVFTFELLRFPWLDDESDPVEEGPDVGPPGIGSQTLRITTYAARRIERRCDAPHRQPVKSVAARPVILGGPHLGDLQTGLTRPLSRLHGSIDGPSVLGQLVQTDFAG